jgi:exopolysaccharide biosynthesis operon protein EpsL
VELLVRRYSGTFVEPPHWHKLVSRQLIDGTGILKSAFLPLVSVALGMLLATSAVAKEGDTFRPFVSLGYFYDSNLFRLAESEYAFVPQLSDQYGVLSAGLSVDWKHGRQQVVASAAKSLVRFDHNTQLDYDGSDYKVQWNWRLGNHWSGQLGATESVTQSSFSDLQERVNNQVSRERRFGRAEWEFHPRWRIAGGVEAIDGTNSAPSQASQDFQLQVHDVVLSYRTPKGSNLRAQVRRLDAEFPNPQCLFPFAGACFEAADNSYQQTEYNLLGDWRLSGKLTLRMQAGWVDRKYDNILRDDFGGFARLEQRPDFSGLAGRITADWYATAKTLLSASLYQELGGAQDIHASSVLKKGASANGVWLVREKWRLNAGVTFENRDFHGDPGAVPGSEGALRNDDTLGASLSLNYAPIQTVSVDVGMSAGWRDSNRADEDYTYHSLFANVRADF